MTCWSYIFLQNSMVPKKKILKIKLTNYYFTQCSIVRVIRVNGFKSSKFTTNKTQTKIGILRNSVYMIQLCHFRRYIVHMYVVDMSLTFVAISSETV